MNNINFKEAHTTNFKKGRADKIKYIVVHYTANNGDTAKNNADYYRNTKNLKASAHYFVDKNNIWQSVKEEDTAYHSGATRYKHFECRNSNSIGVEMCSLKDNSGRYYILPEIIKNTAKLIKDIMKRYGIPFENILRHYDVTGKICPAPMVEDESTWYDFKNMLKEKIESANDIDYILKWKYGISFESMENEKEFIKLLDEEKKKNSKLYWVFYKLVN